MADETTIPRLYNHTSRQRVEVSDIQTLSALGLELDRELAWGLICDRNLVIYGLEVSQASGRDFNIGVGAAIYGGEVLKETGDLQPQLLLDDNVGGGAARIDVIYINGANSIQHVNDDASRVALSDYTRTPVSGEAVGTGDDSTKAFDLDQSGVDIRTLKVQLGGVAAGGWNLSPGTGAAGKDQIIFGVAPASPLEITADYTYESGGAEGAASVSTRLRRYPNYAIAKGTPGAGVPVTLNPETDIPIAQVSLPDGWTGDSTPSDPTITQEGVREFLVYTGRTADSTDHSPAEEPYAGRLYAALRGISQVVHGCRLIYVDSDTIEVSAGWGVMDGVAWRVDTSVTLTLQGSASGDPGYVDSGTAWWYVYGVIAPTGPSNPDGAKPGSAITLDVSQDPPDTRRRDGQGATTVGWFYIGAIYVTALGPIVIRPFFTHGDWVFWEKNPPSSVVTDLSQAPTNHTYVTTNTETDVDILAWIPKTGTLVYVRAQVEFTPTSVGGRCESNIYSHSVSGPNSSSRDPRLTASIAPPTNTLSAWAFCNGIVRAEEIDSSRYIRYIVNDTAGAVETFKIFIEGYLDDYRTLSLSGGPSFY